MEAVAAISLASSIITFVDFTSKIVQSAGEIRNPATGSTASDETLRRFTQDLTQHASCLEGDSPSRDLGPGTQALRKLVPECQALAEEIQLLLDSTSNSKSSSKLQIFMTAAKRVVKTSKREGLEHRLSTLRQELDRHSLVAFQDETRDYLQKISKSAQFPAEVLAELQRAVESASQSMNRISTNTTAVTQLHEILSLSKETILKCRYSQILAAIRADDMNRRYHDVHPAEGDTFQWMFTQVPMGSKPALDPAMLQAANDYAAWLSGDHSVFHILGKPGTGKSTLMKFLLDHPESTERLQKWANGDALITAHFFLWKPGSEMQHSLEGLKRALLFGVLNECPELIPKVCPQQWNQTGYLADRGQLGLKVDSGHVTAGFDSLMNSRTTFENRKCVFFIDGLDEYQPQGMRDTYQGLVSRLLGWCQSHNGTLKLCVSSREYPAFEDGFSGHLRLRLQDLTSQDIGQVATDFFRNNVHVGKLKLPEEELRRLAFQTVVRSDGVFLWVTLVLRNIETGLVDGDELSDVLAHLLSLPTELEGLIDGLFARLTPRHRSYAIRMIQYVSQFEGLSLHNFLCSLPALTITEKLMNGHNVQTIAPASDVSAYERLEQLDSEYRQLARRVKGRCLGLLTINHMHVDQHSEDFPRKRRHFPQDDLVRFARQGDFSAFYSNAALAHRSVKDFLNRSAFHDTFGSIADATFFDISTRSFVLFAALVSNGAALCCFRYFFGEASGDRWEDWVWELIGVLRGSHGSVLEPERVFQFATSLQNAVALDDNRMGYLIPLEESHRCFNLERCLARSHVPEYFEELRLQHNDTVPALSPDLLLDPGLDSHTLFYRTMRALLEAGVNPNGITSSRGLRSSACNLRLLDSMYRARSTEDLGELASILQLLIDYGARINCWAFVKIRVRARVSGQQQQETRSFPFPAQDKLQAEGSAFVVQKWRNKYINPSSLLRDLPESFDGSLVFVEDIFHNFQIELHPSVQESLSVGRRVIEDAWQHHRLHDERHAKWIWFGLLSREYINGEDQVNVQEYDEER